MYNEIEGNFDGITISTSKSSLPTEHGLRKSLTEKPVTSLRQLIDWIDKYNYDMFVINIIILFNSNFFMMDIVGTSPK